MKSIIMPGHEQLDKKAKDQLFKEVKETVAKTTIEKDQSKKLFTVQEMWNRQRRAKSASAMMRRWSLN
jgi:hypothetical protein